MRAWSLGKKVATAVGMAAAHTRASCLETDSTRNMQRVLGISSIIYEKKNTCCAPSTRSTLTLKGVHGVHRVHSEKIQTAVQ